ncbi:MAG: SGNH/GDSL hydrolase family protein, partial [Planctomycetota bacterium]
MKTNHAVFLCCFLIFAAPTNSAEPEPANTIEFENRSRIALVGNSLGERFNLFGHFETQFHLQTAGKRIQFRNFCWPADEVGVRQRPSNYTKIDDPLKVYGPDLYLCFFGTNESYGETSAEALEGFKKQYQELLEQLTDAPDPARGAPRFILIGPAAFESTGHALHPDATDRNRSLVQYRDAVKTLAEDLGIPFIDVFDATRQAFDQEEGNQYTINGIHLNEAGDRLLAS